MDHVPNPYDRFEVISTYTDWQAVEDGLLVAVSLKDRISRAVWEKLCEHAPKDSQPPNCWPVDLMGWFTASKIKKEDALKLIAQHGAEEGQRKFERMIADRKTLALAKGILSTHSQQAKRVYDENIGGGIFNLWATLSSQNIFNGLELTDRGVVSLRLWLIPNELGGMTLMFPEDY